MTDESHYELKFFGNDISPEDISSSELGGLVSSFEALIMANALREYPDLSKTDLGISVISITKGSLGIGMYLHYPKVQGPIVKSFTRNIARNDFSGYSPKETEHIKDIIGFTKRHKCRAQISEGFETKTVLAEITSDTQIAPSVLVSGKTTIYGKLFMVGGKDPNIHIETPSGESMICKVNISQAIFLANKLYSWVGLKGKARWDSKFFQIRDFEVEEIIDFEPGKTGQTLTDLGKSIGKYFKDITNVKEYVDDLRNGEPEGK